MMAGGQSLSLGANAGGLFAPSGTRWRDVFSGGTNNAGALMLTGLGRADGVAVANVANPLLVGYNKVVPATGSGPMVVQTSIPEGAVLACAALRDGLTDTVAFQFHDAGGQSILNLDSNPSTGTAGLVTLFENAEWWLAEATRVFTAEGKTVRVPWFVLNQGEADVSQARGWWLAGANTYWAERRAQITRTTGQTVAPRLLVQQTGGYMQNTTVNLHQCKLDQIDFVRENGGVLIGPLYPYKIDNSDDKGVHKTLAGYISAYEVGAWAMAEVGAGRAWNLLPGTPTRSGNQITIPVSVRGDESLTTVSGAYTGYGGDPANLGLEAVGGGTITAASVSGGNIIVNVSGTVTAIRYAMQQSATDYRTLTDANSEGYCAHRGLIRTTLTRTVTWGGQAFAVERWVPSFEVTV